MEKIFIKNLFSEKTILITGATSGIGKSTALQLSNLGAKLILIGRTPDKIKILKNEIGLEHLYLEKDLSEEDSILNLFKTIPEKYLPLDGLFHSSGSSIVKSIKISKTNDLYRLMSVSTAVALCIGRVAMNKKFFNENSSVVFMSSVSSICGSEGISAYAASKGAINSLVKSLASELSKRKIRVNGLISGAIKTPMHDELTKNLTQEGIINYENKHLLGFGEEKDIANLATFILSDGAKWITGSSIIIDGGYSAV